MFAKRDGDHDQRVYLLALLVGDGLLLQGDFHRAIDPKVGILPKHEVPSGNAHLVNSCQNGFESRAHFFLRLTFDPPFQLRKRALEMSRHLDFTRAIFRLQSELNMVTSPTQKSACRCIAFVNRAIGRSQPAKGHSTSIRYLYLLSLCCRWPRTFRLC